MTETEICSLQITVPHAGMGLAGSVYLISGNRVAGGVIAEWFEVRNYRPRYQGLNRSESGQVSSVYIIDNMEKDDILIFKLTFPFCGVFIFESKNHVNE